MEYKASFDTLCKGMTIGIFVLLLVIGTFNVRGLLAAQGNMTLILVHSGVLLSFVAIMLGSYLFSTQSYIVTSSELIVHRPIKNIVINIADITEIRTVNSAEFAGTIRTFGNGGLFGYYGKYYNGKIGKMTWYVTQQRNRILVRTQQGDKIIISPDDISFIDKVQSKKQTKL